MTSNRINSAGVLAGLTFVQAAIAFPADAYFPWDITPGPLWPALLVAWGATLLLRAASESGRR